MHTRYKTHVMMIGVPNIACFRDAAITRAAKSSSWLSIYDGFPGPGRRNGGGAYFAVIPPDAAASERQTPGLQRLTTMLPELKKLQNRSAKDFFALAHGFRAFAQGHCVREDRRETSEDFL